MIKLLVRQRRERRALFVLRCGRWSCAGLLDPLAVSVPGSVIDFYEQEPQSAKAET
jgi:hypothetical protein